MLILPWDAAGDAEWREWLAYTGRSPPPCTSRHPARRLAGAAAQRTGRGRPPSAGCTRAHSKARPYRLTRRAQINQSVADRESLRPSTYRDRSAATRAGTRRLRLLSVTSCPSASVLGWQVSHLSTDRMGVAKVSRRAHGTRPCPRLLRDLGAGSRLARLGPGARRDALTMRLPAVVIGVAHSWPASGRAPCEGRLERGLPSSK